MEIWMKTKYANYEVSSHGNVKNTETGNTLTNSFGRSNGYYKVTLSVRINGERKTLPIEVHRLVAETFLTHNPSEKLVVDHIDGDKLNNHFSNLQWITQSENMRKAVRVNKNIKLTPEQRQEIRDTFISGRFSMNDLTDHFNAKFNRKTSRHVYSYIARGKRK